MTSIPEPIGPTRSDCIMVAVPLTASIAKTAHAISEVDPPTAANRTMGNMAM